jgi:selenocysteine lyase/cysteine desulfurase
MYKKYYERFLQANPTTQHYASHNHHYWPDITREAVLLYWDDTARLVDDKWEYILNTKIPETQKLVANILKLSNPKQIVFAPNADEIIDRLLSSFDHGKKISILSTDAEFYNFDPINDIEKVEAFPFDNFTERFIQRIEKNNYDIIFFSHVFFNSGMAIKNMKAIVDAVKNSQTKIVIDGRYGFMALPTDLSEIESRVYYLSGPHSEAGEGCCFLYCHESLGPAGPKMDFTALYRLNAVLKLFQKDDLTVEKIHGHIQILQRNFREHLLTIDHHYLTEKNILNVDYSYHGDFLTFAMPSPEHAKRLHDELRTHNIITDFNGSKLHFGFGLYQNEVIDLSAMKLKK